MPVELNAQEKGINCVPLWAIHSILAVIITTSAVFNSFVIHFTRKELKTRGSTYMVCLFCMSVNNLVATCVSLPLHYMEFYTTNVIIHVPLPLSNAICFLRFVSLFTHLGVGVCALNIICWDRYEALTRLGKERRITPSIAFRAVLGTAFFVVLYVVCSKSVVIQRMADGSPYCFMKQSYYLHSNATYDYTGKQIQKTNSIPIIVLVTAIMVSSKTIAIFTFSSITNQVRRHIEEVQGTLGRLNTTKELNLVKVSVVIFVAYTMTWLPYGISTSLMNALASNEGISCFYYISSLIAYSLFSVLPILCAITDNKMKSRLLRKLCTNNQVAPINGRSSVGQQAKQATQTSTAMTQSTSASNSA